MGAEIGPTLPLHCRYPGERNGSDHPANKNNPLGTLEGILVYLVKERLRGDILANVKELMVKEGAFQIAKLNVRIQHCLLGAPDNQVGFPVFFFHQVCF